MRLTKAKYAVIAQMSWTARSSKTGGSERQRVRLTEVAGRKSELDDVLEHPPVALIHGLSRDRRAQAIYKPVLFFHRHPSHTKQPTETRSVMVQSVFAVVERRHHDTDRLALDAAQRPLAVHELAVELEVLPHHPTVHPVNLDDVVAVGYTIIGRDLVFGKLLDEGHRIFLSCKESTRPRSRYYTTAETSRDRHVALRA